MQLPPPPDFEGEAMPDVHPDGSYSIAGLRRGFDERVRDGDAGHEVVVLGWVSKIYVPPPCPEGEVCPPSKQAHVWITDTEDDPGLKRAMLVVGFRFVIPEWEAAVWKGQPEVVLELGKRYAFKGKFRQHTDMGFSHDDGLLEFVAVRACDETGTAVGDWVYPPGAPWHPISIAQQEEAAAKLRARAGG